MSTRRTAVLGSILTTAFLLAACGGGDGSPDRPPPEPCSATLGEVDPGFASAGWFVQDDAAGGAGDDVSHAMATDAQGRFLVAGESTGPAGGSDMVLWRLLPDGSPDPSFGGTGWVVHDDAAGGAGTDVAYGIAVDGQGRVIAAGASDGPLPNYRDMAVWRYLDDGSLDASFDGDGVFTQHGAAGGAWDDQADDVIVDANDRIVVTGSSGDNAFGVSMVVWRFLDDGTLDPTLAGAGHVAHVGDDPGPGTASGRAIAEDASGRLLVAGTSNVFGPAMTIWRLHEDGSLDSSWGGARVVSHCVPGCCNNRGPQGGEGEDIAIDAQGRVVVAGRTLENSSDMAVWRWLPDGSLDPSFNRRGWITHGRIGSRAGLQRAFAVAIDPCGDLYVGGHASSTYGTALAVWRVVDDGRVDPGFGAGGIALLVDPAATPEHSTEGARGLVLGPGGQVFVNGDSRPHWTEDADAAVVCLR